MMPRFPCMHASISVTTTHPDNHNSKMRSRTILTPRLPLIMASCLVLLVGRGYAWIRPGTTINSLRIGSGAFTGMLWIHDALFDHYLVFAVVLVDGGKPIALAWAMNSHLTSSSSLPTNSRRGRSRIGEQNTKGSRSHL